MKKSIFTLSVFLFCIGGLSAQQTPQEALNQYLPEFSNEQISVRDFAISPDGKEIYFSVESVKKNISFIVVSKKKKRGWSQPETVSFSGKFRDIEPAFSPDGNKLYFASNRPIDNTSDTPKDYDIWMVTRTSNSEKWSTPVNLGAPVNSEKEEFYPSVCNNNNLYFTSTREETKGREDIYLCEFKNGKYMPPRSLSKAINTAAYEFNAWVAPDESIIIFTAYGREDGHGGGDLYYSTKNDKGEWLPSLNFGKAINSDKLDYCPFYDTKTGTLYFTSERTAVKKSYSNRLTFEAFKKEIQQSENGLGRIYQVSFKFED